MHVLPQREDTMDETNLLREENRVLNATLEQISCLVAPYQSCVTSSQNSESAGSVDDISQRIVTIIEELETLRRNFQHQQISFREYEEDVMTRFCCYGETNVPQLMPFDGEEDSNTDGPYDIEDTKSSSFHHPWFSKQFLDLSNLVHQLLNLQLHNCRQGESNSELGKDFDSTKKGSTIEDVKAALHLITQHIPNNDSWFIDNPNGAHGFISATLDGAIVGIRNCINSTKILHSMGQTNTEKLSTLEEKLREKVKSLENAKGLPSYVESEITICEERNQVDVILKLWERREELEALTDSNYKTGTMDENINLRETLSKQIKKNKMMEEEMTAATQELQRIIGYSKLHNTKEFHSSKDRESGNIKLESYDNNNSTSENPVLEMKSAPQFINSFESFIDKCAPTSSSTEGPREAFNACTNSEDSQCRSETPTNSRLAEVVLQVKNFCEHSSSVYQKKEKSLRKKLEENDKMKQIIIECSKIWFHEANHNTKALQDSSTTEYEIESAPILQEDDMLLDKREKITKEGSPSSIEALSSTFTTEQLESHLSTLGRKYIALERHQRQSQYDNREKKVQLERATRQLATAKKFQCECSKLFKEMGLLLGVEDDIGLILTNEKNQNPKPDPLIGNQIEGGVSQSTPLPWRVLASILHLLNERLQKDEKAFCKVQESSKASDLSGAPRAPSDSHRFTSSKGVVKSISEEKKFQREDVAHHTDDQTFREAIQLILMKLFQSGKGVKKTLFMLGTDESASDDLLDALSIIYSVDENCTEDSEKKKGLKGGGEKEDLEEQGALAEQRLAGLLQKYSRWTKRLTDTVQDHLAVQQRIIYTFGKVLGFLIESLSLQQDPSSNDSDLSSTQEKLASLRMIEKNITTQSFDNSIDIDCILLDGVELILQLIGKRRGSDQENSTKPTDLVGSVATPLSRPDSSSTHGGAGEAQSSSVNQPARSSADPAESIESIPYDIRLAELYNSMQEMKIIISGLEHLRYFALPLPSTDNDRNESTEESPNRFIDVSLEEVMIVPSGGDPSVALGAIEKNNDTLYRFISRNMKCLYNALLEVSRQYKEVAIVIRRDMDGLQAQLARMLADWSAVDLEEKWIGQSRSTLRYCYQFLEDQGGTEKGCYMLSRGCTALETPAGIPTLLQEKEMRMSTEKGTSNGDKGFKQAGDGSLSAHSFTSPIWQIALELLGDGLSKLIQLLGKEQGVGDGERSAMRGVIAELTDVGAMYINWMELEGLMNPAEKTEAGKNARDKEPATGDSDCGFPPVPVSVVEQCVREDPDQEGPAANGTQTRVSHFTSLDALTSIFMHMFQVAQRGWSGERMKAAPKPLEDSKAYPLPPNNEVEVKLLKTAGSVYIPVPPLSQSEDGRLASLLAAPPEKPLPALPLGEEIWDLSEKNTNAASQIRELQEQRDRANAELAELRAERQRSLNASPQGNTQTQPPNARIGEEILSPDALREVLQYLQSSVLPHTKLVSDQEASEKQPDDSVKVGHDSVKVAGQLDSSAYRKPSVVEKAPRTQPDGTVRTDGGGRLGSARAPACETRGPQMASCREQLSKNSSRRPLQEISPARNRNVGEKTGTRAPPSNLKAAPSAKLRNGCCGPEYPPRRRATVEEAAAEYDMDDVRERLLRVYGDPLGLDDDEVSIDDQPFYHYQASPVSFSSRPQASARGVRGGSTTARVRSPSRSDPQCPDPALFTTRSSRLRYIPPVAQGAASKAQQTYAPRRDHVLERAASLGSRLDREEYYYTGTKRVEGEPRSASSLRAASPREGLARRSHSADHLRQTSSGFQGRSAGSALYPSPRNPPSGTEAPSHSMERREARDRGNGYSSAAAGRQVKLNEDERRARRQVSPRSEGPAFISSSGYPAAFSRTFPHDEDGEAHRRPKSSYMQALAELTRDVYPGDRQERMSSIRGSPHARFPPGKRRIEDDRF